MSRVVSLRDPVTTVWHTVVTINANFETEVEVMISMSDLDGEFEALVAEESLVTVR